MIDKLFASFKEISVDKGPTKPSKCIEFSIAFYVGNIHYFISFIVSFTTGTQYRPKRILDRIRSTASSYNFQYLLLSLSSPSSRFGLLPRLLVTSFLYLPFSNV